MSETTAGTTQEATGGDEAIGPGETVANRGLAVKGELPPDAAERLTAASGGLVEWYEREARDLPWRRTDDPYAILVSEIMLQQTRVETVIERYRTFLERFPDLESLAEADEEQVLAAWSGLGYYRRARFLHRAARRVVGKHDGALPRSRAGLRELPGIGDYTSAAVASIAFGVPALTVDGNVARVAARLLAVAADLRRAGPRRRLEEAMAGPLDTHDPGTLNQALMELGARICLPASPRCDLCPCADACTALALGVQEQLPPSRRSRIEEVEEAALVIERNGRYLLLRGQRPGVLAGMWEFPTLDSRVRDELTERTPATPAKAEGGQAGTEGAEGPEPSGEVADETERDRLARDLHRHLARIGIAVRPGRRIGAIRHGITTRRIRCHVYRGAAEAAEAIGATDAGPAREAGWFSPAETKRLPIAASTRKILGLVDTEKAGTVGPGPSS